MVCVQTREVSEVFWSLVESLIPESPDIAWKVREPRATAPSVSEPLDAPRST